MKKEETYDLSSAKKEIKKLTTRLWAGVFVMLLSVVIMFSIVYYDKIALALSGTYTKSTGDSLLASEWNNLASEFVPNPVGCTSGQTLEWDGSNWVCVSGTGTNFVDKSGDTMTGALTVVGLTVNGTISFSGGAGPFCMFATTCPTGWTSKGLGGILINNTTTCPYNGGSNYNASWNWCHPRICCNN